MDKYRIVKETKEKTKTVRYYLEKYRKFCYWGRWGKVKKYYPLDGCFYELVFNSQEEAHRHYDLLTEKTIIEIITIN